SLSMTDPEALDPPSPFIEEWTARVRRDFSRHARGLDVATGRGRHAVVLAAAGFRTFAVDIQIDSLKSARLRAASLGLSLLPWCADLVVSRLPAARFEAI